jgi:hypothetical protein
MKYENLLATLSALLALLSLRLRKWLKRPKELHVSYQHGSDTSKTNQTTLNLSVETKKED